MIDEAMEGNIDMIVTKSISRFARNTLDCLKYIRQLKKKEHSRVFWKRKNINTMDAKGEVLLTIMASLAQQGKAVLFAKCKVGFSVPIPTGADYSEPQPFPWLYQGRKGSDLLTLMRR